MQTLNANGTYSRAPFANNIIAPSRIDPTVKLIADYVKGILAPNVPNFVPGTSAYVRNNYFSLGTSKVRAIGGAPRSIRAWARSTTSPT